MPVYERNKLAFVVSTKITSKTNILIERFLFGVNSNKKKIKLQKNDGTLFF